MTELPQDSRTPAERVDDEELVLCEMRQAVREALARHKLAGNPVAVWQDGRVVWIPAEEIRLEPDEERRR